MNATTKPTKFPKTAWTECWIFSQGGQQPNDDVVVQLQQLASRAPDAMTFAETTVVFSAW